MVVDLSTGKRLRQHSLHEDDQGLRYVHTTAIAAVSNEGLIVLGHRQYKLGNLFFAVLSL